jgi:hypothetical protein
MKKASIFRILVVLIIFMALVIPCFGFAGDRIFDHNQVLTDNDMFSVEWLVDDIQAFLATKPGTLATYRAVDIDGVEHSAAEIIYNASAAYSVNSKFLIAMLQKEQGLITDKAPSQKKYDWALGYGACDKCDLNDPTRAIFKGFANQIDRCAGLMRWYVDNQDKTWVKKIGIAYSIDGQEVIPSNQATANLYNYTPHLEGNFNLWDIWGDFYGDTVSGSSVAAKPVVPFYPDATLLKTKDSPIVWLVQKGKKRAFTNWAAFVSRYDSSMIIETTNSEIAKYPQGNDIKLAQYSLLQLPSGSRYMIDGLTIRKFESNEVFKALGFNPEELTKVAEVDIMGYVLGDPVTMSDSYPTGGLLQDKTTGGVYYVKSGKKYPIWSKDVMLYNYPGKKITPVSQKTLNKYETGEPVWPKDGTLIKTKESEFVYVISGEERRLILPDALTKLGYDKKTVLILPNSLMNLIPIGADVAI